jgi:hypothetical protein
LISKLKNIDNATLIQRLSDFIDGILAASDFVQKDWWDELPGSVKESYERGMKDIEEGNLIPMEEVMKKYK